MSLCSPEDVWRDEKTLLPRCRGGTIGLGPLDALRTYSNIHVGQGCVLNGSGRSAAT